MIDQASVFAERYKGNPQVLQATVLGQGNVPGLDPYTALNALRLIKESNMMAMAGRAQQPTSSPSILAETLAPPTPPQGLAGMMPMGAPAGQMPQQMAQAPRPQQAPMQAASGGLAGMYTPEEDYAEGGIVAFSGASGKQQVEDPTQRILDAIADDKRRADYGTEQEPGWGGAADSTAIDRAQDRLDAYMNFEPTEMSIKEQEAFLDRYEARMKKAGGEDIYAPARERLKARESALAGDRKSSEGMALLTAAGKILKGRSLAEGASEALPAFAQQLGEAKRAEQQEKRAIEQMNFALADAERKERMGNTRGAQAALAEARKFQQDANRAKGDKLRYGADIAARTVGYSKASGKGAGSGPKWQEQVLQSNIDYLKTTLKPKEGESPEAFDARVRKQASDITAAQLKTSFSTSENAPNKQAATLAPVQERIDAKVADAMKNFPIMNRAYSAAERKGDKTEMKRLWDAEEKRQREIFTKSEAAAGGGGSAKPRNTGTMPPPPAGFLPDNG